MYSKHTIDTRFNYKAMQTYISLLRGINVSGKNLLKMGVLKQLANKLHFVQVQTYIQSGNLVFQSEENNPHQLSNQLEQIIKEKLGLSVAVLTSSVAAMQQILQQCPFTEAEEQAQLYVSFFTSSPFLANQSKIVQKKAAEERLFFTESAAYLVAANGYRKTKITHTLWEQKLQIIATIRNYKTCLKLIEMGHLTQR